MKTPITNSYWVIPDKLLAGEYPRNTNYNLSKRKIHSLENAGIKIFIDLTDKTDGLAKYDNFLNKADYYNYPIIDVSVPANKQLTTDILNRIDESLIQDKKVYLHCLGGVGRTGVIVGCYLKRLGYRNYNVMDKLNELWSYCPKSAYRASPETQEQIDYILNWSE